MLLPCQTRISLPVRPVIVREAGRCGVLSAFLDAGGRPASQASGRRGRACGGSTRGGPAPGSGRPLCLLSRKKAGRPVDGPPESARICPGDYASRRRCLASKKASAPRAASTADVAPNGSPVWGRDSLEAEARAAAGLTAAAGFGAVAVVVVDAVDVEEAAGSVVVVAAFSSSITTV